tara:strand:+ start:1448 stop:1663 length:216 start_codon:yes stop_codon:yes gene_type:complete
MSNDKLIKKAIKKTKKGKYKSAAKSLSKVSSTSVESKRAQAFLNREKSKIVLKKGGKVPKSNYNGWDIQPS